MTTALFGFNATDVADEPTTIQRSAQAIRAPSATTAAHRSIRRRLCGGRPFWAGVRRHADYRGGQLGVLTEDRLLQSAQIGARLETELVPQDRAKAPVDLERIRLPSAAVQRQHQLRRAALAGGLLRDERLKLRDDVVVEAEGELCLGEIVLRVEPDLTQPTTLDIGVGEVCDDREGLSPPKRERLSKVGRCLLGRALREVTPSRGGEELELPGIDEVAFDPKHVAGGSSLEEVSRADRLERLAKLRDGDAETCLDRERRVVTPQRVDDASLRNRLVPRGGAGRQVALETCARQERAGFR